MYFSTFEQKCNLCQQWLSHNIISSETQLDSQNHHTCICNLLDHGGVCCVSGYITLLSHEKELMMYLSQSPRGSNLFLNLSMISLCITSDDEIQLVQQCEDARVNLFQEKREQNLKSHK